MVSMASQTTSLCPTKVNYLLIMSILSNLNLDLNVDAVINKVIENY